MFCLSDPPEGERNEKKKANTLSVSAHEVCTYYTAKHMEVFIAVKPR